MPNKNNDAEDYARTAIAELRTIIPLSNEHARLIEVHLALAFVSGAKAEIINFRKTVQNETN